jgi:hypothetical protein
MLLNLLDEPIKGVNGQNKKTKLQNGGMEGRKEQMSKLFSDITIIRLWEKRENSR